MLAEANELAQDRSTLVVATTPALPGQQCSWCDCPGPDNSPHNDPGYVCGGCDRPADSVVVVWATPIDRRGFPICMPHWPDLMQWIASMTGAAAVDFVVRPVLDDDLLAGT
jgi:hypothetical protein